MQTEQKTRLHKTLRKYAVVLLIGGVYFLWLLLTDIKIPCLIKLRTGWECPACGITRMLLALARLDFVTAYRCNPCLLFCLPIVLFLLGYSEYNYVKNGKQSLGKARPLVWILIAVLLVYGVVRNIV